MLHIYTGGIAATNSYFLELAEGALLVDAAEGVTKWLKDEGLRPTVLFLTHQHFDHVKDAAAVAREFDCPIYAWASFNEELNMGKLFSSFSGMKIAIESFTVDHLLKGEPSVELCGVKWKLLHIPGHSPDSLCIYDEAANVIFGGDVLFAGGVGRTDLPGGSTKQLLDGIQEKLMTLDDDITVYPGHGPATTIGEERAENPFL